MFDRRTRGWAALLLCAGVALAAGCAQEGRLIDVPLPVRAVAFDQHWDTTSVTSDTVNFSTRLKIQVHASNPCEAANIRLELSRIGDTTFPTFVVQPVARYNADSPCTALGATSSDTVVSLTVTGQTVKGLAVIPFQVPSTGGPTFSFGVDSTMHSPTPATIRFDIKVEDKTTAAAVVGATVALDSLTTLGPLPITSGLTDGTGRFVFDVPTTAGRGVDAFPYRVTVTNGPDQQIVSVHAPARGKGRERVVVRI